MMRPDEVARVVDAEVSQPPKRLNESWNEQQVPPQDDRGVAGLIMQDEGIKRRLVLRGE